MKSSNTQAAGPCAVKVISIEEMREPGKRIRDVIARRAYELYEKRGRAEGHAQEDWSQAEAETIFDIPVGVMQSSKSVNVYAGTCGACADDFEMCVEPHRLTLAGRVPLAVTHRTPRGRAPVQVFRVIDLPVEVDPPRVTAKVNNGLLEVEMTKREAEGQAA
jgi:HSP20 family molecular chaperone IbpA